METAIIIGQLLVKYGPTVAKAAVEIFKKPEPTLEDWDSVFEKAEKSYDAYIAQAQVKAAVAKVLPKN